MAVLTVFRQARADGGTRTGIEFDGRTLGEWFQPGSEDDDNRLLWYVDIQFESSFLPSTLEEARTWLIAKGEFVRRALTDAMERLSLGFDSELKPYSGKLGTLPDGVEVKLFCSAIRRLQARDIQPQLKAIADHWEEWLKQIEPETALIA